MHRPGIHDSRVQTGTTGWISIHINDPDRLPSYPDGSAQEDSKTTPPARIPLFEQVGKVPLSLPERFPRLTFLAIAIALLVTALTAEVDYLRGAGYFWR